MTRTCRVCWGADPDRGDYHARCLRELFGVERVPAIDVDLAGLHTLALAMVGHTTLSGAQRKLSVHLDEGRATLRLAVEGGHYILKPQAATFPNLPEIEWVTQRLASLAGIEVPPAGLFPLKDGSVAYVVRRFDRLEGGGKLRMEDFCQLAGLPPSRKYDGSAELCGHLVADHATQPLLELLRLFRLLVFNWWVGNGDLHLKNLALLAGTDGMHRLSPAYDQLATRLVLPGDPLALTVGGKRDNLKRSTWLGLASDFGIGPKAAERVLRETAGLDAEVVQRLDDAPLPEAARNELRELVTARSAVLRDG